MKCRLMVEGASYDIAEKFLVSPPGKLLVLERLATGHSYVKISNYDSRLSNNCGSIVSCSATFSFHSPVANISLPLQIPLFVLFTLRRMQKLHADTCCAAYAIFMQPLAAFYAVVMAEYFRILLRLGLSLPAGLMQHNWNEFE